MVDFLQLAFAGLAAGAAYGLMAVGFVAIYSVSGVINLVQGEFAVVAAFVAITLVDSGAPVLVAVLGAVAATVVLAGVVEQVGIAPARGASTVTFLILTLGISVALRAVVLLVWGADPEALPAFTAGTVEVGGVRIRYQDLWVLAITAAVAGLLTVFLDRTLTGKAFVACSQQPVAARLMGISPARMSRLSFLIAGATGALAGIVVSPTQFTTYDSGLLLGLKGFVAASLAGLVSIRGAILGGLLLGVLESLGAGYLSSGLRDAIAFLVLIAVLIVRPGGVFSRAAVARV